MKTSICCAFIAFGAIHAAPAPFVNLGFEDARTNSVTPSLTPGYPGEGRGPVNDLLPGWRLLQNGQPVMTMDYNNLGRTFETRDYQSVIGPPGFGIPTEGQFALSLVFHTSSDYRLVQRGEIPRDAQRLFFQYELGPFVASVNGEDISPLGLPYTVARMPQTIFSDISRFAGQTVELSFRASGPLGSHHLDNIGFIVPEPSTPVLAALGVVAMVACGLRRCLR